MLAVLWFSWVCLIELLTVDEKLTGALREDYLPFMSDGLLPQVIHWWQLRGGVGRGCCASPSAMIVARVTSSLSKIWILWCPLGIKYGSFAIAAHAPQFDLIIQELGTSPGVSAGLRPGSGLPQRLHRLR